MREEQQYRIVHRKGNGPWKVYEDKALDKRAADRLVKTLQGHSDFFEWGVEYSAQSRGFKDWKDPK